MSQERIHIYTFALTLLFIFGAAGIFVFNTPSPTGYVAYDSLSDKCKLYFGDKICDDSVADCGGSYKSYSLDACDECQTWKDGKQGFSQCEGGWGTALLEGKTKVVPLSGKNYEVTLDYVDSKVAKFSVNGESASLLSIGKTDTLADGTIITLTEIIYQGTADGVKAAMFTLDAPVEEEVDGDVIDWLNEGSIKIYTINGADYEVTLDFTDSTHAKFSVNGDSTAELSVGESDKAAGALITVKEILYQSFAGGIHRAQFSLDVSYESEEETTVTSKNTCQNSCNGKSKTGSCYCDTACAKYGDCCSDYNKFCGGEEAEEVVEYCYSGTCINKEEFTTAVYDKGPASDVTKIGSVLTSLIDIKGVVKLPKSKLFSEVNALWLDKKVTLVIYYGEAIIIVGEHSPVNHVLFATKLANLLSEKGIIRQTILSSEVPSANLLDLFEEVEAEEEISNSCKDSCGSKSKIGKCWCDFKCKELGDCCSDYQEVCGGGVTKCTDSDGGKDYYVKGFVNDNGEISWDICTVPSIEGYQGPADYVFEKFCNVDGHVHGVQYHCPNGCKDGACLAGEVTPTTKPSKCTTYFGDKICDDSPSDCGSSYKSGTSLDACDECQTWKDGKQGFDNCGGAGTTTPTAPTTSNKPNLYISSLKVEPIYYYDYSEGLITKKTGIYGKYKVSALTQIADFGTGYSAYYYELNEDGSIIKTSDEFLQGIDSFKIDFEVSNNGAPTTDEFDYKIQKLKKDSSGWDTVKLPPAHGGYLQGKIVLVGSNKVLQEQIKKLGYAYDLDIGTNQFRVVIDTGNKIDEYNENDNSKLFKIVITKITKAAIEEAYTKPLPKEVFAVTSPKLGDVLKKGEKAKISWDCNVNALWIALDGDKNKDNGYVKKIYDPGFWAYNMEYNSQPIGCLNSNSEITWEVPSNIPDGEYYIMVADRVIALDTWAYGDKFTIGEEDKKPIPSQQASCIDSCGSKSSTGSCYCDKICVEQNPPDCCPDYKEVCGGLESDILCGDACKEKGMDDFDALPKGSCEKVPADWGWKVISGTFGDVGEGKECCCLT